MPLESVALQPRSQGVGQVDSIALEPKGGLKLQKGEIEPLPPGKHGFASIDNAQIKESLRFNMAKGHEQKTASEKINHIHKVAFATGRTDELPSVRRFWNGFKRKVADSAIGRFVQRNILHHVANTKINSLDVKAQAVDDKKTTLRFELKAQKPSGENTHRIDGPEPKGHEIEVTFDRLRNQRSWFNPKRWIGNDHRTGQVVDILAKLQVDVSRQVRLRNLGIGLEQEKTFASNNPGLLAALPEATPKKGVTPPNASDYAKSELQNFKTAAGELGKADWIPLLDKAIGADTPKAPKLSKNELAELRKIALTVEFQKLDAIRRVCGDYAFTDKQIADLDRLAAALVSEDPGALDKTITSLATSLREMSIMAWSAMVPLDETTGGSYGQSLERLLVGKTEGILPMEVLMSPCFMSPEALRKQAENMEVYANTTLQKNETTANKLTALEEKFQAIGQSNADSRKKAADLQGQATGIKDTFLENAGHLREIAESSAGMYRFQGMLPILAGANGEQLQSFIQQKLDSVFQQTTGLQPANRLGQVAVAAGGGALTVAAAFKGNVGGAVAAGGASLLAVKHLEHDGSKYSDRLQALSDAILGGIASGSEEQLIQANRLIAEEKCDQSVQKWATNHQGEIQTHSRKVGQEEDINNCSESLSNLAANNNLGRSAETEKIRGILGQKIEGLAKLEGEIQKTNDSIDQGPGKKVKIHSELTVDQVVAHKNVQTKLSNAGKSVDSECKALKGSFEILQSAYQNEGKERGRYYKQITGVEDSIANSIKDWKKEGDSGIEQGLAAIRSALATDAPKLTNDHATHLHDLTGHLEKAANQAKELKATMLEVGKGLASPSIDYMTGSLDKNVFQEGARFVQEGKIAGHIHKLETAKAAVGETGKNPYALFRDTESREALSKPLGELLEDSKKSQDSWNKCLTNSSAMVDAAQKKKDIHQLKASLKNSAEQMGMDSQDLQRISDKYKDLQPNGPGFDFSSNIQKLHEASLRTGAARLVGLSEVPPPESCHAALDLLSGPLADPDLHKSVAKYLEQSDNKSEALKDLFSKLPEAGKSPTEWTPTDTEAWKARLQDKPAGLDFIGKLFNYQKGGDELSSAIKTATMISSGEMQKSIIADLYSKPIESSLGQAAQNENLKTVFPNEFKNGELHLLFEKLAGKVDILISHGLDENLRGKAPSVAVLFKKFQNPTTRAELEEGDYETLLKFTGVFANLKASPEATRQHQLRLAALDLLSNVDQSFRQLENPTSADKGKLREAFTPTPENLEEWEKFQNAYKATYKEYDKLEKFVQKQEREKSGSQNLFEKWGGDTSLLNPTSKDVEERRNNLLNAHRLYSIGEMMAKFKTSESLADQEAVLTKSLAAKELKKEGINFELLKWTNIDTCSEDEALRQLDQKILYEEIATNPMLNFRAGQSSIYYDYQQNKSTDVVNWLKQHGKRPAFEKPLDTVTRLFAKGCARISYRLNALKDFLEAEKQIKDFSPKLAAAQTAVKNSSKERDLLLGEHQSIVFKNAVRSAILSHCVDKGIDPASLSKDSHEAEIKELLQTYGWSEKSYPAGLDIVKYFEEAKHDGFLKTWTNEAGSMRSDLTRIEGQIEKALNTLKDSLLLLSSEISKAAMEHARGMREEGKSLAREGSALLASAKAHAENLEGGEKLIHAKSLAVEPLGKLCQRLVESHPEKKKAIEEWEQKTTDNLDASMEWEKISSSISAGLDDLHDELLDCKLGSRPPYFESLVASRALEFDRAAIQGIRQVHDETAGKVETEVSKIGNLRMQLGLLSVQDALPEQIVADSDGKPRTWVKNFFNKNQDAIRSDEKFGNSQDAKALAAHFNKMQPLDFLKLFKNGGDLHNFFSDGAGKKSKEFANLISHMGKLREGFEGMDDKLSSYEGNSFKDFLDSTKFSPPSVVINGNDDLNSIGNILRNHKFPDGVKNFQELVGNTKINIMSEKQFNQTVAKLETDLVQRMEVHEAEDNESLDENISEYGDNDSEFQLDIREFGGDARLSGQAGLEEFMRQSSFSARQSQQLEQLNQSQPALVNPPIAQGQSQASPRNFDKVKFDSFALGDTPRPKTNNTDWNNATGKPQELQDFVHIPARADGYCLLTSLAATRNQTTTELIADLKQAAQETGETESLNNELEKAKSAEGIDHKNIANLLNKLGIAFKEVQLTDANPPKFFASSKVPENAKLTPNSPVLLFRGGHFDLLLPKSVAEQYNLPYDGSQFIKNDVLQK